MKKILKKSFEGIRKSGNQEIMNLYCGEKMRFIPLDAIFAICVSDDDYLLLRDNASNFFIA